MVSEMGMAVVYGDGRVLLSDVLFGLSRLVMSLAVQAARLAESSTVRDLQITMIAIQSSKVLSC